jgi:hypothetical protein
MFLDEIFLRKAALKKLICFLIVDFEISSVLPINTGDKKDRQDHDAKHSGNCHDKIVDYRGLLLVAQSFTVI